MTTMNRTDSPSSKFSAQEVKVNAELLYQYANLLGLSYEKWTIALRETAKSLESIQRFRLFKDSDGRLYLNYDLAIEIVSLAGKSITGAIAHLLMEEAENGLHGEDPDCVNQALGEFASSIVQPLGFVEAEKLHQFLEVREDCDSWWCRLKKARKPKAGTDYECVKECSGRQTVFLWPAFAKAVAVTQDTPRGRYLKNHFAWVADQERQWAMCY